MRSLMDVTVGSRAETREQRSARLDHTLAAEPAPSVAPAVRGRIQRLDGK